MLKNFNNIGIFKAYDVRGRYPQELNEGAAVKISRAAAKRLGGKIVIAHDVRLSSPALYKEVLKSLKTKNYKLKAISGGMMTTPMFYFLVNKLKASGGIMITASHNPPEYNGMKIVGKSAMPISGKEILRIMNLDELRK